MNGVTLLIVTPSVTWTQPIYIYIYKIVVIYLPKCAYWKVINLHIWYTKMCLLKGHNLSYWIYQKVLIDRKNAYWMKMCLLNENMSIDWKDSYWMKMYIDWKCVYWMKKFLLAANVLIEKWKCTIIRCF